MNNPEEYIRPAGEIQEFRRSIIRPSRDETNEVSLAPHQQVFTEPIRLYGHYTFCWTWQTQYGPMSATAEFFNDGKPAAQCSRHGTVSASFTNKARPQVIRFTSTRGNYSTGLDDVEVCRSCPPLPTFDEVSNPDRVLKQGRMQVGAATVLGLSALVLFIGIPTVMGLLYELGRHVFPSGRARRVRQAFEEARTSGETFDTTATHEYNDPAANQFRQQQETDDMQDMAAEVRAETERIKRKEHSLRAKREANLRRKKELAEDLEEKIRRVKELQERERRESDEG